MTGRTDIEHVEYWNVKIAPPSNPEDLWEHYTRPPLWDRGKPLIIEVHEISFRLDAGRLGPSSARLRGRTVRKDTTLGEPQNIAVRLNEGGFFGDPEAPQWVRDEIEKAVAQVLA